MSALIQCHFDYACSAWYSGLTKRSKLRLQVAQNKVIRFLLNVPPRAHIGPDEFRKIGMLPVEQRVNQLKLNHMYNIFNGHAPEYVKNQVQRYSNCYNTRNSISSFMIPRVKGCGSHSFNYTGAVLWNTLPLSLRQSNSISVFKKSVKDHLMSHMSQ